MSRWFRHYAGMCADPKFGGIARRAKVARDRAVFVFAFILEDASERNDGGRYEWDADAIADLLNCETEEIERVHAELNASGIVEAGHVASWAKRQFESDKDNTAAERQRRFRERHARENVTKPEPVTPVTDASRVTNAPHSTETDTEKKEKENSPKRVRTSYPEDFEKFWESCSAWRGHSGKSEALTAWRKLSPEDRLNAASGVAGYSATLRVPNAPTALHVCRYLSKRRFEIYAANVLPFATGSDPPPKPSWEEMRQQALEYHLKEKARQAR